MESPEVIFGKNTHGQPCVQLENRLGEPKQDIILDTCYRNSRPILCTAHALGFGIYREKGIVQIFENKNLWFDIGYKENTGRINDGELVNLIRTSQSSPKFLEEHSNIDDLIQFKVFETSKNVTHGRNGKKEY